MGALESMHRNISKFITLDEASFNLETALTTPLPRDYRADSSDWEELISPSKMTKRLHLHGWTIDLDRKSIPFKEMFVQHFEILPSQTYTLSDDPADHYQLVLRL